MFQDCVVIGSQVWGQHSKSTHVIQFKGYEDAGGPDDPKWAVKQKEDFCPSLARTARCPDVRDGFWRCSRTPLNEECESRNTLSGFC